MRKWISVLFKVTVLIIGGFVILILFLPKSYNIPVFKQREGTRFWTLKTGSRIAYMHICAKGEKKPFPIIFLQGGPGGPIYDENIRILSKLADSGYDVFLYDQIGCGFSDRLKNIEEYTVERHKRDLENIVEILSAEKVILIGQSWGAILAAEFIADNPGKVDKVIFTSPGYLLPVNPSLAKIKAPDSLNLLSPQFTNKQGREKVYTYRAKLIEMCAKAFSWKLAPDKEMDEFETILDQEMRKSTVCNPTFITAPDSRSGFFSMVKTVQSFDHAKEIRSKLRHCTVPALIMRGQCDWVKWGYVTEYLDLFANHKLVMVPGAGHSIAREQPELYIKTILDFLR